MTYNVFSGTLNPTHFTSLLLLLLLLLQIYVLLFTEPRLLLYNSKLCEIDMCICLVKYSQFYHGFLCVENCNLYFVMKKIQ